MLRENMPNAVIQAIELQIKAYNLPCNIVNFRYEEHEIWCPITWLRISKAESLESRVGAELWVLSAPNRGGMGTADPATRCKMDFQTFDFLFSRGSCAVRAVIFYL